MRLLIGGSLATGITVGVAALALAGAPTDPNEGDDFVAKAGKLRYSQDSALADSGTPLLAGCGPASWHLLGGGEVVSGPAADSFLRAARGWDYTDPDVRPDDGWYASGAGPPGAAVTATAICRKNVIVRYRSTNIPLPDGGVASGKLGCGGPRWHVSSGSIFVATSGGWINSSHPVDGQDRDRVRDDGWRGRAYSPTPTTFALSVICVRNLNLVYKRARPRTLGTGTPARTGVRAPGCPKPRRVIGGGGRLTGPGNRGRLVATTPADSSDGGFAPDDRWLTRGYNLGGAPLRLDVFVICAR